MSENSKNKIVVWSNNKGPVSEQLQVWNNVLFCSNAHQQLLLFVVRAISVEESVKSKHFVDLLTINVFVVITYKVCIYYLSCFLVYVLKYYTRYKTMKWNVRDLQYYAISFLLIIFFFFNLKKSISIHDSRFRILVLLFT